MKRDYIISINYCTVSGGTPMCGRVLHEFDHKLNRKDIIDVEDWFIKKHRLFSASVVAVFELDPEPEVKNEPEELNPCTL
jgi:hypothetical protein